MSSVIHREIGVRLTCGTQVVVGPFIRGALAVTGIVTVRMARTETVRVIELPWLAAQLGVGHQEALRFKKLSILHLATEWIATTDWRTLACCPQKGLL
jgi:hypothetical protein